MKAAFIIYADSEPSLEKITCHYNPKKMSTTKINNIQLLAIHCSKFVHLIQQKTRLIVTGAKTA